MENNLKHVAIIMDGNGRWAQGRNRPRFWGHVRGAYRVSDIVEKASDMGIEALTLYAFSTENWSRPVEEVKVLFKLLYKYLKSEFNRIVENKINFQVIGDIKNLDIETKVLIRELESSTENNIGLKLTFCFGYSGRSEITNAVNKIISDGHGKVDENLMNNYMLRPEIGDVDLLIRTGGDKRISNFLLWQVAYAELYFEDVKWPEFSPCLFEKIVTEVSTRGRRYGGVDNTVLSFKEIKKNIEEFNINNLS